MSDTMKLTLGNHDLDLYVADGPRQWRQGLVGHDLTDVDGMLFVFGREECFAFGMTGMTEPILVAFFSRDGALVELTWLATDARPHQPAQPYQYVLELVGRHATTAGAVELLPDLVAGITVPP